MLAFHNFQQVSTARNCTPCLTRSGVKHNYYNVFGYLQNLSCFMFCEEITLNSANKQIGVLSQNDENSKQNMKKPGLYVFYC